MQIAESRKQVRIRKPRALEQDRSNTKGAEWLPNAPSYWKECPAYLSWPISTRLLMGDAAFAKAGGDGVQGLPLAEIGEVRRAIPWFTRSVLLLPLSNSFSRIMSKNQPWYSPGKKGNMARLHIVVERKSSHLQRIVLKSSKGRAPTDEQSWFAGGKGADEHFILHSSITLPCFFLYSINHTALPSGEAVPPPRTDLGTSNVFKIHKKKVVPAELKSKPTFPRLFLGQQHPNCVVSSCAFVLKKENSKICQGIQKARTFLFLLLWKFREDYGILKAGTEEKVSEEHAYSMTAEDVCNEFHFNTLF